MPDAGSGRTPVSGDLAFLSGKEFDGKLRTNEGVVTTTGDLATLTATTGKDMYLASAQCSTVRSDIAGLGNVTVKVELKLNGVVIETWIAHTMWNTSLTHFDNVYNFKIGIGKKVLAGQIIKLEVVTNAGSDNDFEGAISCFEEDTGVDPRC